MKRNNKLFDYSLIFLAAIALGYFFIVIFSSRFITAYLIYPIVSAILFSYSYFELKRKQSILSKLPLRINYLIKGIIIIMLSIFIIIEGLIIAEAKNSTTSSSDFVVVLGARLNGNTPSKLLTYRLEAAAAYHKKYPQAIIIVSGGKGNGENISEAEAMKNYLVKKGIDEKLIIEETQSTNTNENIIFSKKIINTFPTKKPTVTIITNGFHCFRSKLLANKHGLKAKTYAAKENSATAPHYYLREFFGCLKDLILS